MTYYARSASNSTPNQTYFEHITNVVENAFRFWVDASHYRQNIDGGTDKLAGIVRSAAAFHDLGKLDDANQKILSGSKSSAHLHIPHQDAGVAFLLSPKRKEILASLLVYAHHIGLPNLSEIQLQNPPMRIGKSSIREVVDQSLETLLHRHEESKCPFPSATSKVGIQSAFSFRILFSCLTDADHGDAARASGKLDTTPTTPTLQPNKRLDALKNYVSSLSPAVSPEEQQRNALRAEFFKACLHSPIDARFTECDAPVGTGKTTAVMAHLLHVAEKHQLRRIFVILPFTNIIQQSVVVYRKSLVLPGENPNEVVAEIHHRADFETKESRQLTALWNAPIVVTTAVAFFETLASNHPATLRRLHNLPGSAVFLDEAHAMLPAKLLPLAWKWMNIAAKDWSCFWTLASGSLNRFWELEEFKLADSETDGRPVVVQNILPKNTQDSLFHAETNRVTYRKKEDVLSLESLCNWLDTLEGPVLIVLNTVQTAAATARIAAEKFGADSVFHLSTSLSPKDREVTLGLIKVKLKEKSHKKWFLFATSCVEAGVDFSFRTGVREAASLASLLQLAGRINRNAEFPQSDVWTVSLDVNSPNVGVNPAWAVSSRILSDLFATGNAISPSLCTESIKRELRESGKGSELQTLFKAEDAREFRKVNEEFRVIQDNTVPTVVDQSLIERIERFEDVSWRDIQMGSVNVQKRIIDKFDVPQSIRYPGVFLWKYEYTPFLGYMAGVLKLGDIDRDKLAIL